MKNKESIWNFYAPVYDKFAKANQGAYEKLYEKIRAICFDKTVLEIATGTGLIAKHIAAATKKTIATDFAENMLKEAQKGIIPSNLEFRQANAETLPFSDNSFDVVIIANALHIIEEPEKVLAEIARVLKPEGILIAPNYIHETGNLKTAFFLKCFLLPESLLMQAGMRKPTSNFWRRTAFLSIVPKFWKVQFL